MAAAQLIAFAVDFILVAIAADMAAGADADEINRNENVSHLWGARGRAILLLLPCIGFNAHGSTGSPYEAILRGLLNVVLMWIAFGAEFWLVFDLRLNQRRGLPWYYLGSGAGSASADDTAMRVLLPFGEPGKVLAVVKMLLLLVSLAGLFAVFDGRL